jgi:hypothetical protein
MDTASQNQQITCNINTQHNEDNEAEIDLDSEDDDLGSADHKQDKGWHDALDEDEDDEDEDAEMDNDTSNNESNDEDGDDNDDDKSLNSQLQ